MEVKILDYKKIENKEWFFGRTDLISFLKGLKEDFYSFSIQRRIVKNPYLDKLIDTIILGDPIPAITLTYFGEEEIDQDKKINIEMSHVEILDGLQRTFRLWSYYNLCELYNKNSSLNASGIAKKLKDKYPKIFESGVLSVGIIRRILNERKIDRISKALIDYNIHLIFWSNLNEDQVIEKMLVLNAGQKSVSKTHQFELMFLHVWLNLQDVAPKESIGVKILREKEEDSFKIKRGDRKVGDYLFSTIIVSLQSYLAATPKRVSIADLTIPLNSPYEINNQELDEIDEKEILIAQIFKAEFIRGFLHSLKALDETVFEKEDNRGLKWFVKDTTLSGISAAIGANYPLKNSNDLSDNMRIMNSGFKMLQEKVVRYGLNLKSFDDNYDKISGRSVNIGNYIRAIVDNYIRDLLENQPPKGWDLYFQKFDR